MGNAQAGTSDSNFGPNTLKTSAGLVSSTGLSCGVSSMQGWRPEMEVSSNLGIYLFFVIHSFKWFKTVCCKDEHIIQEIPTRSDHLLLAVFDGHGGYIASKYAFQNFLIVFEDTQMWRTYLITNMIEDLNEALRETFLTLDLRMQRDLGEAVTKCGCTSVVAIVTPTHILCANAGDSRCVLGSQNDAFPLSEDHKPDLALESSRIISAGGFVTKRRTGGVSRVDSVLAVSRGLGDFRFKSRLDLPQKFQKVTCNPDIKIRPRNEKDEFLILACDGLWDVLSSKEVVQSARTLYSEGESNEKLMAEELIDEAFSKGSKDNISVIVARMPGVALAKTLTGGVLKRRSRRTGEQELTALYVQSGTYCLNEHPSHPFRNINTGDDTLYVQSNVDPELLIHITFRTTVKITSIAIKPGSVVETQPNSAPQNVQLYVNLTSPSFTNIEDEEIVETVTLDPVDVTADGADSSNSSSSSEAGMKTAGLDNRIRLKRTVKFQRVSSLTIFIKDNYGDDFTSISELNIFGFTLDGFDVANIHEVGKKKK